MFVFKTIVLGTIFLFIALIVGPWFAMQFDASYPPIEIGNYRYVGAVLFTLGFLFAVYCALVLFMPGKIKPAPYYAGCAFVIGGPYRYMRNPFMTSVITALWGEAIYMERIVMFGYAIFFTWAIYFFVVLIEEPALEKRFPKEFKEYREAVPRWFPRLRRYEK